MPDFADTFYAAEAQAKAYKLHLFSDDDDPTYPTGDYVNTSLLDLKVATENYIKDKSYVSPLDGAKVRVRGTVAGFSNGTLYIQSYFEESDSEDVRGEGKGHFAGFKGDLYVYKFHIKTVFFNFLLAGFKGGSGLFTVLLQFFKVVLVGAANNLFKRFYNLVVAYGVRRLCYGAALGTKGGIYHYDLALAVDFIRSVKIVFSAAVLKF